MQLTGLKKLPFRKSHVVLVHLAVKQVKIGMKLDEAKSWTKVAKEQEEEQEPTSLDAMFSKYTAFTMTPTGKIIRVFHAKQEDARVTAMKKAIIAQLQCKKGEKTRLEKDGAAKHVAHYKYVTNFFYTF